MASEIDRVLYDEAHLLDSSQFRAWLELLATDLRYGRLFAPSCP